MKWSRWLSALLIVVVTVLSLGFVKFQQIQAAMAMAAAFPEPSATVKSIITTEVDFQDSEKVTGQVSATQVVELQNEVAGIITQVNFNAGDKVKKGQLLLALNSAEESAQLAAAKANLVLSENSFNRLATLLKQNKVSQQEFDNAKAQVQVNQANVDNLVAMIAKKHVYAPFDGTVGLDTFQTGQFISAYSKITTLVGEDTRIWIDFQLAQTQDKLNLGDTVLIKAVTADNSHYVSARIIAKNSQIQRQSRHLSYRAELVDGRKFYEHNEIVDVKVLKPNKSVIIVPNSAISRNQTGDYLFVLKKDDHQQYRAHRVSVQLGKRLNDEQIIHAGINAGELIATEGAFKLREGLLVYPKNVHSSSLVANLIRDF